MTTEMVKTPKEIRLSAQMALRELRDMIKNRPASEKLIINGKQYLYFYDWQTLGAYFGITVRTEASEITEEYLPSPDSKFTIKKRIGFWGKAQAIQNGQVIASAESMCLKEEKNWQNKDWFAIMSMAETRAGAKALRNCLQWVVKLPDQTQLNQPIIDAEVTAEEAS